MSELSSVCDMPRSCCNPDGCKTCTYKDHLTWYDKEGNLRIVDDDFNDITDTLFRKCEVENCPITINNVLDPVCDLYNPEDKYIGTIRNATSMLNVRVQIKKLKLEGYYVVFKEEKIHIDINGNMESYPKGFYDSLIDFLSELV